MKLNLKARFTNKAFVTSFIAALILLIQQLGLGKYLPENIMDIVNTVFFDFYLSFINLNYNRYVFIRTKINKKQER